MAQTTELVITIRPADDVEKVAVEISSVSQL